MERGSGNKFNTSSNHQQHQKNRERIGLVIGETLRANNLVSSPDFVLQWGNKKRLRCMKIQTMDQPALRTTARVIRIDPGSTHNFSNQLAKERSASLRNSENMRKGHGNNGVAAEHVKLHTQESKRDSPASALNNSHRRNISNNNETTGHEEDGNKKGGGSSSGSEVIPPVAWPPKFVIALTNKEKEEDFMAIKGSKLPQRPRKRSKYVQRNLKLVSPGAWLCDLTLDRYEVREKKTSNKRPRGLKAMCNSIESDSE
ncbi:unnamed protein product [Rhodiola kirilowii]